MKPSHELGCLLSNRAVFLQTRQSSHKKNSLLKNRLPRWFLINWPSLQYTHFIDPNELADWSSCFTFENRSDISPTQGCLILAAATLLICVHIHLWWSYMHLCAHWAHGRPWWAEPFVCFPVGWPLEGSDSWSTTIGTEPFSTSIFEGLVPIFANTIKICTQGWLCPSLCSMLPGLLRHSSWHHFSAFIFVPHRNSPAPVHRSSAIHFSYH